MISLCSPYDHSFIRSKFKHTDSPICLLTCWYTNADSLINKLDELKSRTLRHPDIICVSEVFPKHCSYDVNFVLMVMIAFTQHSHMMYVVFVLMLNLNIKLIKLKLLRYHFERSFGALSL